jgi:hypothetical protein
MAIPLHDFGYRSGRIEGGPEPEIEVSAIPRQGKAGGFIDIEKREVLALLDLRQLCGSRGLKQRATSPPTWAHPVGQGDIPFRVRIKVGCGCLRAADCANHCRLRQLPSLWGRTLIWKGLAVTISCDCQSLPPHDAFLHPIAGKRLPINVQLLIVEPVLPTSPRYRSDDDRDRRQHADAEHRQIG